MRSGICAQWGGSRGVRGHLACTRAVHTCACDEVFPVPFGRAQHRRFFHALLIRNVWWRIGALQTLGVCVCLCAARSTHADKPRCCKQHSAIPRALTKECCALNKCPIRHELAIQNKGYHIPPGGQRLCAQLSGSCAPSLASYTIRIHRCCCKPTPQKANTLSVRPTQA